MALCLSAQAQKIPDQTKVKKWAPLTPVSFSMFFGGGRMNFRKFAANKNKIGQDGQGVELSFGFHIYDLFNVSLGAGRVYVDEYGSFTELMKHKTTGQLKTGKSDLLITQFRWSIGTQTPYLILVPHNKASDKISIALLANTGNISTNGTREIDECEDCTTQTLDFNPNPFYELGTNLRFLVLAQGNSTQRLHLIFRWRNYFGKASLDHELIFGLRYSLGYTPPTSVIDPNF
ncbi:hypothetical protein [uncultured Microscilla sp.]|uniref:hypothetical protein n=1 Tax=uncultured Microscilla sp. TaxID=432653 RepID=UPI0026074F8A|nr:hypothetical protein [uncultured Microscilla sp.]